MDQSGAPPTPESLHPRLTVALASHEDRQRVAGLLSATTLRSGDLLERAGELTAERSLDRAARRATLEAAARRAAEDLDQANTAHQHLTDRLEELHEGATWARAMADQLPDLHAAVEGARQLVDEREGEQRAASAALERVLEQRAAANAAMEEAGRELHELAGVGMDETGLRRELEASGRAVGAAQDAHARALSELEALRREEADLDQREAALRDALNPPVAAVLVAPEAVARVDEAFQAWRRATSTGRLDPDAQDLADAWGDLQADLAEVRSQSDPLPDVEALEAAERRLRVAAAAVDRLEAASPSGTLTADERAAVDAAHEAVLDAEERAGRRLGAAAARKRLEQARAHESSVLAALGFASYLDVVLTGGRRTTDDPARVPAQRELREATLAYEALRRTADASPDLAYLDGERARLHSHAAALLRVDPGDDPVPLLRAHREVPDEVVDELRDALEDVAGRPVGTSLADAAAQWLDRQRAASADHERWQERVEQARADLEDLLERRRELQHRLAEAERAEAGAAEELELAGRSVGAFEAELTMRADEGAKRLKRFSAAEQLRTQIEALAATLERAEHDSRRALDEAAEATVAAEASLDRAAEAIAQVTRRARDLAAQVPADQRPEGDPLTTLDELAAALDACAEDLADQIDVAAHATEAAAACHEQALEVVAAAPTGAEGPQADDLRDAVGPLLDAAAQGLVVLDEPFSELDLDLAIELLDLVAERSAARPVIFLTEQPALVGHAIELPADVAAVVPAEHLLNSASPDADEKAAVAPFVVELGEDESAPSASPVPRWAGRR